jgi:hypothetical protein
MKSGRLHGKHETATSKLGNISEFAWRREKQANVRRDGLRQDIQDTHRRLIIGPAN